MGSRYYQMQKGYLGQNKYSVKNNVLEGKRVLVRWLRPWGNKPIGFEVAGVLTKVFVVHGRTIIGEIETDDGRTIPCPWSKNYLYVEPQE